MTCTTDWDCPTTLICYTSEQSWFYEGFGDDVGNSTCACATWYGWTGDDCLELSMPTYVSLSIQSLTALGALIWGLLGAYTIWRVYRVDRENKFFTAGNITAIFCNLALWLLFAWRLVNIVMFTRPDLYYMHISGDTDKLTELTVPDRTLTALTACFTTLSGLNISLMWLQVADESRRLRHQVAYLTWYRKVIIAFEITYAIAIIAVMAANVPFYATLVSFPFILFVVVTFLIGQHKMTSLLNSITSTHGHYNATTSSSQDSPNEGGSTVTTSARNIHKRTGGSKMSTERYRDMLRLIRTTSRSTCFFATLVLIGGAAYAGLALNWKEYAKVGKVSPVTLLNDLFILAILGVLASVQWYVWEVLRARVQRIQEMNADQDEVTHPEDNSFTNTSFKINMKELNELSTYQTVEQFRQKAASFHTEFEDELKPPPRQTQKETRVHVASAADSDDDSDEYV